MQRNFKEEGKDTVEIKYLVIIPKKIFLILWIISSFPTTLFSYVPWKYFLEDISAEKINKQAAFGG